MENQLNTKIKRISIFSERRICSLEEVCICIVTFGRVTATCVDKAVYSFSFRATLYPVFLRRVEVEQCDPLVSECSQFQRSFGAQLRERGSFEEFIRTTRILAAGSCAITTLPMLFEPHKPRGLVIAVRTLRPFPALRYLFRPAVKAASALVRIVELGVDIAVYRSNSGSHMSRLSEEGEGAI